MAEDNFYVSGARAIAIRQIILQDEDALGKWKQVKNDFMKSVVDRVPVNRILEAEQPKHERAILLSLSNWCLSQPENAKYDNLVEILAKHQLNKLTDKLKDAKIREQIHDAILEEPILENDSRFPVKNFPIDESRCEIGFIICDSKEAIRKWSIVKDAMVKAVDSNLKIDSDLDTGGIQVHSAVYETLSSWISREKSKANFHKLLAILVDHDLVDLKNELIRAVVVSKLRQLEGIGSDPDMDTQTATATAAELEPPETQSLDYQSETETLRYHMCPVCKLECWDHMVKCGHFICEKCLDKLLQSKKSNCPTCREPFKALGVIRAHVPY